MGEFPVSKAPTVTLSMWLIVFALGRIWAVVMVEEALAVEFFLTLDVLPLVLLALSLLLRVDGGTLI